MPVLDQQQKPKKTFDDVFQFVHSFGRYQQTIFTLIKLLTLPLGFQFGLLIFGMGTPRFHCADTNSTCPSGKCCENCTSFVFDEGQFTSTVTEWNLICDRAYLGAAIQSSFFGGMLLGSVIGGWLSDSFGRRTTIYLGSGFMVLTAVGSAFSDAISLIALLRFGVGFALPLVMLSNYVYCIEIIGPNWRLFGGRVNSILWPTSTGVMVAVAYLIREWRYLILAVSFPGLLIFLCWRILPESPRWLVAHDRVDEAYEVLCKCGYRKTALHSGDALRETIKAIRAEQRTQAQNAPQASKLSLLSLFGTAKLRRRTLNVMFNWFVCGFSAFGFFFYITSLSGNLYLNVLYMAFVKLPSDFLCYVSMKKLGRRLTTSATQVLAGALCLLVMSVPKEYPMIVTVLALSGQAFIYSSFLNIYLFTSELFPTVLRNSALGIGSMSARVGAIIAPYVALLAQLPNVSATLPVIIYGATALAAGILALWLPETLYTKLPQTIQEAEEAKEDYGLPCWRRAKGGAAKEEVIVNREADTKL